MKGRNILLLFLLVTLISTTACGGKIENKVVTTDVMQTSSDMSQEYLLNTDSCLTVSILQDVGEKVVMSEEDSKTVLAYLNSGVYNKECNDSGIRYKMKSPDYTFLIEIKGSKTEMVQLWLDSSLILLKAKWYTPLSAANVRTTLDKYSK